MFDIVNKQKICFEIYQSKISNFLTLKFFCRSCHDPGVSNRPLTREDGFQYLASLCAICSGESDTGTGFFSEDFGFPLLFIIPPVLRTHNYKAV